MEVPVAIVAFDAAATIACGSEAGKARARAPMGCPVARRPRAPGSVRRPWVG